MAHLIQPLHHRVIALAVWLDRQQQIVIDYLTEENRVLKEQLEGQLLCFTDEQGIRLAVPAKVLAAGFFMKSKRSLPRIPFNQASVSNYCHQKRHRSTYTAV